MRGLIRAPDERTSLELRKDNQQRLLAENCCVETRLCGVEAASRNVQSSLIPSLAGFVAVMAIRLCEGPDNGVVSRRRYRCGMQKIDSKSTGFGRRQSIKICRQSRMFCIY